MSAGRKAALEAADFIRQYMELPDDADIEFGITSDKSSGEKFAFISFCDGRRWHFSKKAANVTAKVMEESLRQFPSWSEVRGFDNVIVSLRHCAEQLPDNAP